MRTQLNIGDFVDDQPVRSVSLWVFALCFLSMLSEGYDLGVTGLASIVFGVLVIAVPLAGALAIALCVGVYTLFFGVLMVSLGIRLRGRTQTFDAGSPISIPTR